jgi:Mg2+/Co2+ transporter CorC
MTLFEVQRRLAWPPIPALRGPSAGGSRRYFNVQRADSRRVHQFLVTVSPG